jgi:hypothetical protein
MKRLVLATLLLCGAGSAALAASNEGSITATLEITAECEVITAPIGASTANFTSTSPVALITTANYTGSFDAVPSSINGGAQPTTSAGENSNVAVLCSAGGSDHTVAFSTSANMTGGSTATELAWTAQLDGTDFVDQEASDDIIADADDPTLTTYTVTGEVTALNVANAVPDTYTAEVEITVTY